MATSRNRLRNFYGFSSLVFVRIARQPEWKNKKQTRNSSSLSLRSQYLFWQFECDPWHEWHRCCTHHRARWATGHRRITEFVLCQRQKYTWVSIPAVLIPTTINFVCVSSSPFRYVVWFGISGASTSVDVRTDWKRRTHMEIWNNSEYRIIIIIKQRTRARNPLICSVCLIAKPDRIQ